MNRSQLAKRHGATCVNERFAWSYINEDKEFVIFGAWNHHNDGHMQLILSENWERNSRGRKQSGFAPSVRHIERIVEDGFRLYTFPMFAVPGTENGPSKIEKIVDELTERQLVVINGNFYAVPIGVNAKSEPDFNQDYWEGARREVVQTKYERNPEARKACLEEYGFFCSVCGFNFEEKYGELGKGYIHVHHLIMVSERKTSYKVNPLTDMRPVCPSCHAMIHKRRPPYTIEEMKKTIANSDKIDGAVE